MNQTNDSESQKSLSDIFQKLQEIAAKSADGNFIFRGEPQHYEKVSSSLWRECEEMGLELPDPYNNRGNVYSRKGEYKRAINDYDEAIERKPDLAEAYYNRGMAFLHLQEWEKAKVSLTEAEELQENIVMDNFGKDYNNVADFEKEISIQLPSEIAALLTLS